MIIGKSINENEKKRNIELFPALNMLLFLCIFAVYLIFFIFYHHNFALEVWSAKTYAHAPIEVSGAVTLSQHF